jgi:outer membrane protein OmpA-like peptidoglycan-associated protein
MRDSQGNPVRGVQGACVDAGANRNAPPPAACVEQPKRTTYRILQNLIPQPTVSFAPPPPLPPTESVRFLPRTAFGANQAGISNELREELFGFLASLEGYQRIERFEVIGYSDGNPKADYGQWLGEKRAESARNFLIARGISAAMVEGRGVAKPDDATRGRLEILVTVRGRR